MTTKIRTTRKSSLAEVAKQRMVSLCVSVTTEADLRRRVLPFLAYQAKELNRMARSLLLTRFQQRRLRAHLLPEQRLFSSIKAYFQNTGR